MTEIGYYYLMDFFYKNKIDVQVLYELVGFCYLTSLFYITRKLSLNQGLVIASYMLASFLLDVVQLRFTLSLTFVLWGFYFLLKQKNGIRRVSVFYSFVIVATLFHSSSCIYLLYGIALIRDNRKFYMILIVAIFSSLLFSAALINYLGDLYNMQVKIEEINSSDRYKHNNSNIICCIYLTLFILMYVIPYYKVFKKKCMNDRNSDLWFRISLVCIVIFPLIWFSADIRRMFIGLLPIQVCIISNWITKRNNIPISAYVVGISFIYLYSTILRGANLHSVFYPIFERNVFL